MCTDEFYKRAEALERLGGDEDLFAKVISLFIADNASYCRALEEAMAAADTPRLQREAHTVKSVLASFSCETGVALALRLENQCREGPLAGVEQLTSEVVSALKRLAGVLTSEAGAV